MRYLFCLLLITVAGHALIAQTPAFNGVYYAQTSIVKGANIPLYTYLRFYPDGTVYSQAINSPEAAAVAKWFGRFKTYSRKGAYTVSNGQINVSLSNAGTADVKMEGEQSQTMKGSVQGGELCLITDSSTTSRCFSFLPVHDTLTIKYYTYDVLLKVPGEWRKKQLLQNSGQVFLTNADSTIIAFMLLKAANLKGVADTSNAFASASAYYK